MWDFYTPKKQIFEIFDYNDDGWLQALEIEERLIRPFFNTDKWCLNENCGGKVSLNIKRKAGRESGHIGGRIAGKKFKEENLGIFAMSEKEKHERNIKGGKIIGKLLKEQKRGIFAIDAQQRSLNSQKGAKKVNAQKWQCTVTGYISNPGALSTYQKKRGIDVSKRRKIE
jgi:hypothetical protein